MSDALPLVWMNGQFIPQSEAHIDPRDAGFLHGAGVFTTLMARHGRPYRLSDHLGRLRESCQALFVPLQQKDEALVEAVSELLKQNNLTEARIRITVTRGSVSLDPVHGPTVHPLTMISAARLEPYPAAFAQNGVMVLVSDQYKLNPYDMQAGHKTLDYLSRLTALRQANEQSAAECLWFDVHNYLQSGSISNVFVVRGGKLVTPPTPQEMLDKTFRQTMPYPRSSVLPGVTRKRIIELSKREGIETELSAIAIDHLLGADEVFVCNSIMGILPVVKVESHAVGGGAPGPITRQMIKELADDIAAETETI